MGRPSSYTQEVADAICERLADGKSLRSVCRDPLMPAGATVFKWMRENEEFLKQYTRAKQESSDAMAEDIIDISDSGENDTYVDENGVKRTDNDVIQRSKLRVETRKWLMAKMKPKKYGDKLDVTSGGKKVRTVTVFDMKPKQSGENNAKDSSQ